MAIITSLSHAEKKIAAERCDVGFEKVNGECVDIDECKDEAAGAMSFFSIPGDSVCNIEKNYHCVNTVGSYRCECREYEKPNQWHY